MPWESDYQSVLTSARNRVFTADGIPRQLFGEFIDLFSEALGEINRDAITGRITSDRAESLARQINDILSRLSGDLAGRVTRGVRSTAGIPPQAHREALAQLELDFDPLANITSNFDDVPVRALRAMALRRGLPQYNYRSLLARSTSKSVEAIDEYLFKAVARGISTEEAKRELTALLIGDNPKFQDLLYERDGNLKITQQVWRQIKRGEIDLDVPASTVAEVRSFMVDARRIVRTEIPTAFREAEIISAFESPVVGYLKWQVSGRHYGLPSSPDICTMYHEGDMYGLGSGIFPIRAFPSTPHPNCGCYSSSVMRSPEDWDRPKFTPARPARVTESEFADMFQDKTDNDLARQVDLANNLNALAFDDL